MIDPSIALVIVGSVIQVAPPATRIARSLRSARARTDASLRRDPLIAGIARIYDRA